MGSEKAAKILKELECVEDSALWEQKFEASKDVLEALYDEAIAVYEAGRTSLVGE